MDKFRGKVSQSGDVKTRENLFSYHKIVSNVQNYLILRVSFEHRRIKNFTETSDNTREKLALGGVGRLDRSPGRKKSKCT